MCGIINKNCSKTCRVIEFWKIEQNKEMIFFNFEPTFCCNSMKSDRRKLCKTMVKSLKRQQIWCLKKYKFLMQIGNFFFFFLFVFIMQYISFWSIKRNKGNIVGWEPEGHYRYTKSMVIVPFWLSMEHLWSAIMPFWLPTDNNVNLNDEMKISCLVNLIGVIIILQYNLQG